MGQIPSYVNNQEDLIMKSSLVFAVLGLCSSLIIAGCATTGPGTGAASSSPTPSYAGFFAYPDRLAPAPGGGTAVQWIDPEIDLSKYNKILLERVRVRLADDAEYSTIDPTELKGLADYFHQAIVKALGAAYPVVKKPGPGVLRVRIALTDLVPTKPEYSVVALVVPYATVADVASGAVSGGPIGSAPYLGRTGIAAEFIDGRTNRVVAEYADTEVGRKYVVNTNQGISSAVTTGLTDYADAYSTWAYAKQAFDQWAADFRRWLDQTHGR